MCSNISGSHLGRWAIPYPLWIRTPPSILNHLMILKIYQ